MNHDLVKDLLAVCHEAKRITEMMPRLPQGVGPRHLHILDTISQLKELQDMVRVSDVSDKLKITRPSITKVINELEQLGIIQKVPDTKDKRVTLIFLTERGEHYRKLYVLKYHSWLEEQLKNVKPGEVLATVKTIRKLYQVVKIGKNQGICDDSL